MNTFNTTFNKSNKGGADMEEKLRILEQQLAAELAKRDDPRVYDFEAVACIRNEIADLKGEVRPYDAEWFEDL